MVFCMASLASCFKVFFSKSTVNNFFVSSFYSLKTVLACVEVVLNSVVSKNMVGY